KLDDAIGIAAALVPHGPPLPRREAADALDEEEIRATEVPIAGLLHVEIDEHVAAGEKILALIPAKIDYVRQQDDLQLMPKALQVFTIAFDKLHLRQRKCRQVLWRLHYGGHELPLGVWIWS